MTRLLINDPSRNDVLNIGLGGNDGSGTPLRVAGQYLSQWASDINSMTAELYNIKQGVLYGADFGISSSAVDNGPLINNAIAAAIASNCKLVLPAGILAVSTPIVAQGYQGSGPAALSGYLPGMSVIIEGAGAPVNAWTDTVPTSGSGTWIYWAGGSIANALLTVYSLGTLKIKDVAFWGANNTQHTVYCSGHSPDVMQPFAYTFEKVFFGGPAAGFSAFCTDNTDNKNNAAFTFYSCCFQGKGSGTTGYLQNPGPNNIGQIFFNCVFQASSFGQNTTGNWDYAISANQGTIACYGGTFDGAAIADIFLRSAGGSIRDCWSQNSNSFLKVGNFDTVPTAILVESCTTSSTPFAFWKQGGTATQPSGDTQYATITVNNNVAPIIVTGCTLVDPFAGAQGNFTPTICRTAGKGTTSIPPFIVQNTRSSLGAGWVWSGFYGYDSGGTFFPQRALGTVPVHSVQAPTTGFNIALGSDVERLILNPAGTLATGTVVLPAAPHDGQDILIFTEQTISLLTLSVSSTFITGTTIVGGVTSLSAGTGVQFTYDSTNNIWYRST